MATKPFEPTSRAAEKRDQRVTIYFTPSELERITAEALKRGTTVHNLLRIALQALLREK